jgi:uncharacterized protein YodC (DUF2158 family)
MFEKQYDASDLIQIAPAESFRVPGDLPLTIGNRVRLNSGGPTMLIVDAPMNGNITCAWKDAFGEVSEISMPEACLHLAG